MQTPDTPLTGEMNRKARTNSVPAIGTMGRFFHELNLPLGNGTIVPPSQYLAKNDLRSRNYQPQELYYEGRAIAALGAALSKEGEKITDPDVLGTVLDRMEDVAINEGPARAHMYAGVFRAVASAMDNPNQAMKRGHDKRSFLERALGYSDPRFAQAILENKTTVMTPDLKLKADALISNRSPAEGIASLQTLMGDYTEDDQGRVRAKSVILAEKQTRSPLPPRR